ncbi:hypothetical protein [Streptomyces sp. NPDC016845]|uniref:hypothetical protein n=1 Tax=Streptomyces sp. NPDC016845 TaxID=3364972 RepID=UPI0037A54B38
MGRGVPGAAGPGGRRLGTGWQRPDRKPRPRRRDPAPPGDRPAPPRAGDADGTEDLAGGTAEEAEPGVPVD